jgi:hypothetical protein
LTEWYVNTEKGIEQGFEIAAAPVEKPIGSLLRLTLELTGSLKAQLDASKQSITFSDCNTSLTYSGLKAFDSQGQALAAHMKLESGRLTLAVDDTNALYPIKIDPLLTQQVKLFASDSATEDQFGTSVAISGDNLVVGDSGDDVGTNTNQGSAYVFIRNGTTWIQQQQLTASDGETGDRFGQSVAISGDTVVVGANGHNVGENSKQGSAYIFFSACNTAPTIVATTGLNRQQGSPATPATLATVSDFQDAADSLAVTATSVAVGISINGFANNNGSITAFLAASCSAALGANTINLRVTDSNGATSTTSVIVNVTENTPPSLGVYPATTVSTGGSTTITPSQSPIDNGAMNFDVSIPGYLGDFTFNPVSGTLTVHNASPQGVYTVTVKATDNCGFITSTAFSLMVGASSPLTRRRFRMAHSILVTTRRSRQRAELHLTPSRLLAESCRPVYRSHQQVCFQERRQIRATSTSQ